MKPAAQEELANRVIRLVRSGDWKKLRTHKDKSIHNYLTRNLQNRENMLARFKILQELGADTPEEIKSVTKQAQYDNQFVIEKSTGREGVLAYYDDQGQAWVVFNDTEPEVAHGTRSVRQPTPVDIRSLQFAQYSAPFTWQFEIGQKVSSSIGEVYVVMNRTTSFDTASGGDIKPAYLIKNVRDPSDQVWTFAHAIKPAQPGTSLDIREGDQVVDIRYNILGQVTDVINIGAGSIKVEYDKKVAPQGVTYQATVAQSYLQKYDPSKHNPSDMPETPMREGQVISRPDQSSGSISDEKEQITKVWIGADGKANYFVNSIPTGKGELLSELDVSGYKMPVILNPDPGQIFKRRRHSLQVLDKPRGVGDLFVRFLYFDDYSNTTAVVQTPFGKIRKVELKDFEPATSNELARLNMMFDRVKMPQQADGVAQTQLKPGQSVKMPGDPNHIGVISTINYNGTATLTYKSDEKKTVTVTLPLDQLTPADEPAEKTGVVAYDQRTKQFVDVVDLGTFDRMKVRTRSPEASQESSEYMASRSTLQESSEEAYADAVAKLVAWGLKVGDKVRAVSAPADFNGVGVIDRADQFTATGDPIFLIKPYGTGWGRMDNPRRNGKPATIIVGDDLAQITKINEDYSAGELVFDTHSRDKIVITGEVPKSSPYDSRAYYFRYAYTTPEEYEAMPADEKSKYIRDSVLLERPIDQIETEFGDLSQYIGKFIEAEGTWPLDKAGAESPPRWLYDLWNGQGNKDDRAQKYVIIGHVAFNERKNGIDVRLDQVGGSGMWRTTIDKDTFKYITKFMRRPSEVVHTSDPIDYEAEIPSLKKDERGQIVDYKPSHTVGGVRMFSVEPLFKINSVKFRDSGEYERNVQSNPAAVAAAIDELLFLSANRIGDEFKFTQLAQQNGHIDKNRREKLDNQIKEARANLFNGLSEGSIKELYDRSQYKAQFATALSASAQESSALDPSQYAEQAEKDSRYAALGKILADKRTYEKLFDPKSNIVFTTGPANEVVFTQRFRGRPVEGGYAKTAPMMMMTQFLMFGSRLEDGAGMRAIGDAMPFDGLPNQKLKKMFNYLLGYRTKPDGSVETHPETGIPLLELDENGNCPAAIQSDESVGDYPNKLQSAARALLTRFDSNGRDMQTFIGEIATSHSGVDEKYLQAALDAFADNEPMPQHAIARFTPQVLKAVSDRSVSPNGESLLDMLSIGMSRKDDPWKSFAPRLGSMKTTEVVDALLDKSLTLNQAKYLSGKPDVSDVLLTTVYNRNLADKMSLDAFIRDMDTYIRQYDLQDIITEDIQRALISSDYFLSDVSASQLYDLIKGGFYEGVDLDDKMGNLGKYESLNAAVNMLKAEYIESLSNLENIGDTVDSGAIKNKSILSHLSREAFKNVSIPDLRNIIFKPGRSAEETTKLAAKMSKLFFGDPQSPQIKYGAHAQAGYKLFDPLHQIFDMNGKLWPKQFSYLSDDETEEIYSKITPVIRGVEEADYRARVEAAEASKEIQAVNKELQADIYKALDPKRAERFEKMYKMFTGDLAGQTGSAEDDILTSAYHSMSTIGYLSQDQLEELAKVFDLPSMVEFQPTTSSIVRKMVGDFIYNLSPDELQGVASSMSTDKMSAISSRIYDQIAGDQLQKLRDKISVIEKDPLTNKPARDSKGDIKRSLDLLSMDRKRLEKSLGIIKDEEAKNDLTDFLDKLGVAEGETDKQKFKSQMQALQDSPALLNNLLKRFVKLDSEQKQIGRALRSFEIVSDAVDASVGGPVSSTLKHHIASVLEATFLAGVVPPATGVSEGIAGSIPHTTVARYNYVPSMDRGNFHRVGDALGPEFNVSHIAKPELFIPPDGMNKEDQKKFREALTILSEQHGHDNNVAWLRAEVFKVSDGGEEQKILGVREIQIDGLQKFSRDKTRAVPEHLKEGDHVMAYDPADVKRRIDEIDKIKAQLDVADSKELVQKLTDEMKALISFPPKLIPAEVEMDEHGKPFYRYKPEGSDKEEQKYLKEVFKYSAGPSDYTRDFFNENMYHHRKMNKQEQAVMDEMKKGYHMIYRSLLRAAVAAGCDKVYVLPSWTAMYKPIAKGLDTRTPVADSRHEVMGTFAQQTKNLVRQKKINEDTGEEYTDLVEVPATDKFGNEVWQARGISQPAIDGYDNTAKEWGFTLKDLDHFWQTDPYWGYGASLLVTKAWVFDLKNDLARQMAGRRMAKKKPVKMIIAQINQSGEALAAYLTVYFAIQMRDAQYQFDKSKAILQEAFFQWLYDPSNRNLTQDQIKGAIAYAGSKIGVDMSEINDPAWKFGEIPQEAYDRLIESGPAQAHENDERPPVAELAKKLDKIMLDIMPNLMDHPEYRSLKAEEIPIRVAKDLLNEPLVFPWSAVREDMDYRLAVLRAVTAFDVSPEKEEELAAMDRDEPEYDPLEQAISEEPTAVIEEPEITDQIANQLVRYLRQEGDTYSNFVTWIDAEAPELHANDALRTEVLAKLNQAGFLLAETAIDHDVPSADDLDQLFRESKRLVTGKLQPGDRVEVFSPASRDIRAKALAVKRAKGKVCASTKSGYVVEFDDAYDERILNSQRWLFGDVHLLKQGRQV